MAHRHSYAGHVLPPSMRDHCTWHAICAHLLSLCAFNPVCCAFPVACWMPRVMDADSTPRVIPNLAQALRCDCAEGQRRCGPNPRGRSVCPRALPQRCVASRLVAVRCSACCIVRAAPVAASATVEHCTARRRRYGVVPCGARSVRRTLISYTKTSRPCCRLSRSSRIMRISSA